jgi:hypothetical protein
MLLLVCHGAVPVVKHMVEAGLDEQESCSDELSSAL